MLYKARKTRDLTYLILALLTETRGGFLAELWEDASMLYSSCGRWSYDCIEWFHWNPDHGDDMIASLIWSLSGRGQNACHAMLVHYGMIHDKRGNIVWRLYEEENTWWEPANPVDPVNWLISRHPVQTKLDSPPSGAIRAALAHLIIVMTSTSVMA